MKTILLTLLFVLIGSVFASCGSDSGGTSCESAQTIIIDSKANVTVSGDIEEEAEVSNENGGIDLIVTGCNLSVVDTKSETETSTEDVNQ